MIQAVIFDLDGTLVETEGLKALSYARAAVELCPNLSEDEVLEAFKDIVGRTREEVAQTLVERIHLAEAARTHLAEWGVSEPWQAFAAMRLAIYQAMVADPKALRKRKLPQGIALLHQARASGRRTALASMSHRDQVQHVLKVLRILAVFDFIASRDDVASGKPDPEIYRLVSRELGVPPSDCLVIEDSPSGVEAARAAGMWCMAVTTDFTRAGVHASGLLDERWIVDDPLQLEAVFGQMIAEQGRRE